MRVDSGEHSFLGIPRVEACPVLGFNKEELRTVDRGEFWPEEVSFHRKAFDRTRKVCFGDFQQR